MHNLNTKLFYFINGTAGRFPLLDQSVVFLTTYLVQIVFVVVGIYMIVWVPLVQTPPTFLRLKRLFHGFEMILALVSTWAVVKIIKLTVAFPRPFETLADSQLLVHIQGGDSFPSGHAALTTALATTVYLRHKPLGVLLYIFAGLVALSRLYVGVHYPLDVFVGILMGILVPVLFYNIFNR